MQKSGGTCGPAGAFCTGQDPPPENGPPDGHHVLEANPFPTGGALGAHPARTPAEGACSAQVYAVQYLREVARQCVTSAADPGEPWQSPSWAATTVNTIFSKCEHSVRRDGGSAAEAHELCAQVHRCPPASEHRP